MNLFEKSGDEKITRSVPLATRMRPRSLSEFVGQKHLLGQGKLLRKLIETDTLRAAIFFGPPGTGKTTLVEIISRMTKAHLSPLSAVTSSVGQVKEEIFRAKNRLLNTGQLTILFVDEFHRFNRAQQEVLLPPIEEGRIGFIGLTTVNPFFALAPALLSRTHLFEFKLLSENELGEIARRALRDPERGLGNYSLEVGDETLLEVSRRCEGDARRLLRALEVAVLMASPRPGENVRLTPEMLAEALAPGIVRYDRNGDDHYDAISAYIKSIRGTDPDAALYWLARMLKAGEDPRFIARRLVIAASEDIGNADPQSLTVAVNAARAVEYVGMPEAQLALAQATTFLAAAPKSNAAYQGLKEALEDVELYPVQEVPEHLKNNHYRGAQKLGRGVGYKYPHSTSRGWVAQEYLKLKKQYYRPSDRGYEVIIRKRLERLRDHHEDQDQKRGA